MTEAAIDGGATDVDAMLAERARRPVEWREPVIYDRANGIDEFLLGRAVEAGEVKSVDDRLEDIAGDLFEYEHPGQKANGEMRAQYRDYIVDQGKAFGKWVLHPWSGELVRYPDVSLHRALKTSRNRPLVSTAEQQTLYGSTVAVFGLSVGSKIVEQLVESGIGGTLVIGDPDRITPSNLNRMHANLTHVGMRKLDKVACDISVADPYIKQVHFKDGATPANLEALTQHRPDIIFDEVDDLRAKVLIRLYAQREKIPVVMVTDLEDKTIVDVERYDLGGAKPFGGRLKSDELAKLQDGTCSVEELKRYTVKVIGMRHVTPQMLQAFMEVGKTVSGIPQLGSTATRGGSSGAIAAREIILGRDLPSGRYMDNPRKAMKLQRRSTVSEAATIYMGLLQSRKNR